MVSHYDCDGISSAIIANIFLDEIDKSFEQVFLDELTEEKIKDVLEKHDQPVVFFTDIGSGQRDVVSSEIGDERTVLIADHHEVADEGEVDFHVNPMLINNGEEIDGGEEISGAGVTFLVADSVLDDSSKLLPYALVGATGDIQKKDNCFKGPNRDFLEKAEEKDMIEVKNGLRLYGRSSKSLVKALKYTTEPYLEGITENESGTVQFLRNTGIELRDDDGWRSLSDLSEEEEKRIINGLIKRGYEGVENLLGTVYVLNNGWEIQEFSSLLNACGKLEKPKKALDICVNEEYDKAWDIKKEYGRKISKYLSILERKLDDDTFVEKTFFGTLIKAGNRIDPNIIGTVTTIATKSGIVEGPVVVGMAEKEEDKLKISSRVVEEYEEEVVLNELMEDACEEVGGKGGGHRMAAGGKIPKDERDRFIKIIKDSLKQLKE